MSSTQSRNQKKYSVCIWFKPVTHRKKTMRNLAFYLLFYLHPVVRLILTVMVRIGAFGAVGVLIFTAMNGTWKSFLGLITFLFAISLVAVIPPEIERSQR